ncbi:MAG: DUF192 domain-containing protein [Patescibacteria group bacterium]
MNKKIGTSIALIFIFFVTIFFLVNYSPKNSGVPEIKSVNIGGVKVSVDLAQTSAEQELGLGGRSSLANDAGMLFIFNRPGKYYFWMKGMNFPLDMIWLSEDLHVIYIKKNAQPSGVLESFGTDENSKYVLEVNAGFTDAHNIKVGDEVLFGY